LGIDGVGSIEFATNGTLNYCDPRGFTGGQTIDAAASWSSTVNQTVFAFTYENYMFSSYQTACAPDRAAGTLMGFRFTSDFGTTWNYGWLKVTWTAATTMFEILRGAYESTAGVGVMAPAGGDGGDAERRTARSDLSTQSNQPASARGPVCRGG
jgi:hypothetical protein